MSSIAALIVAAGQGQRAGGPIPKQFQPLLGLPVLRRTAMAFALPEIQFLQIVTSSDRHTETEAALDGQAHLPFAIGGATRQDSVRNGLEALAPYGPEFVLVHDAARPLVSATLIRRVVDALKQGAPAAIPLVAVADTLKRDDAGQWTTVQRDALYRAQTPQGFRFATLLAAHREYPNSAVTDDMALAELAGVPITRVTGEETNLKITTEEDFSHAARLLHGMMSEYRTGQGFDVHQFAPGDHIWLCGIKIPHSAALEGHSDADAGLHALTDAVLGALGAGDIGNHFPPTDEKWRGAPSSLFLAHAAELVAKANGALVHCDVTLICERPKIAPYRDAMRARIAEILGIEISRVSVKATTTEGLGFTGRREGLAAQAIATLRLPPA
jgi:2-C-methyl-D-erythritol 4-phosphate cytidylyltransferase/2-C-methyl-D-erythritol 2,4-cyclodiphosphate synthase